ncbi:MAG TPA: tripartite tricarboxylate transporter TctB family protein [Solirubrobacterales bacterium]|nr:tripartite tricarboxylate transporter TctB family protein [Solirubrobacterales bacterium]
MTSPLRNPKDFWPGVIFVAAGLAVVLSGREYAMGTTTKMGPGYFPTVLGALLALLGLALVGRSCLHGGARLGGLAPRAVLLVLGATTLFGVLLRGAGLFVALAALTLVSASASREFEWGRAVVLAVGLAGFSVLVFVKALGLPIPVLGAWFGG